MFVCYDKSMPTKGCMASSLALAGRLRDLQRSMADLPGGFVSKKIKGLVIGITSPGGGPIMVNVPRPQRYPRIECAIRWP